MFVAGDEGVSVDTLAEAFELPSSHIETLYTELRSICDTSARPYSAVFVRNNMALVTKPQFSDIVAKTRTYIDKQPLTKSQIEILAILLYKGPSTKSEIDAYRGVNSAQAVRGLMLRGMIDKTGHAQGSSLYTTTSDTLHMLGVTDVAELPEYAPLKSSLETVVSLAEKSE